MAFVEMKTHKLRSFLSVLGVMLGVASLVMMLTLIGGIDKFLNVKMGKWIGTIWYYTKWDPSDTERLSWSRSPGLRLSDGDYLKANSEHVKRIPKIVTRRTFIIAGDQQIRCNIRGIDTAIFSLDSEDVKISAGRWLSNEDFTVGTCNTVLSWQVASTISKSFNYNDSTKLIGKQITFDNKKYTIVGIFEPKSPLNAPWNLRRSISIPLQSMLKYATGFDPDPEQLQVEVTEAKEVKVLSKLIAIQLKARHRGVEDFEYRTADWLDQVTSMLNNVSLLMTIISILSLTIGGLSIMNVMLSSISERIREIGIRKALGANAIQIFIQFIAETITLSITGGILGIIFGMAPLLFKEAIMASTEGSIEPTLLPLHVLFTYILIILLGIVFGMYPAIKASRMRAIDALRYE
jgi:putative ABC transport system permease protein